jgi:RNA methyltransferase, TrmH family
MLSKNQIRELQSLQLKKQREQKKLFIAEGIKTVKEIIDQRPAIVKQLYCTRAFSSENSARLKSAGLTWTEVNESELKNISLQSTPNAVLAVCRYFEPREIIHDQNNFALYLDDIRDPGNMGTLIRIADWFGATAVYCSPSSCELYNPKVIQASMGAFLRVHVEYTLLTELVASAGIRNVYGAVLNGKDLYNEKLEGGLIVIGNEANGIHESNLPLINRPITIPANKNNGSESLNAAMAGSIIAGEFFRQLRKR